MPKFLNLLAIRFPVGAIASILHRVSGVALLASLPMLADALDRSLRGPAQFEALLQAATHAPLAPLLLLFAWALTHHVFAGVRHLLMDVGIGVRLATARASAAAAIVGSLATVVAAAAASAWVLR